LAGLDRSRQAVRRLSARFHKCARRPPAPAASLCTS